LAGGGEGKRRTRRSYRPTVETMEALRLLSSVAHATPLPGLTAEQNLLADSVSGSKSLVQDSPPVLNATWDSALDQTRLVDLLGELRSGSLSPSLAVTQSDTEAMASGLSQLNKYLSRAWYRAAIPVQLHEDCTQAVYTTLLQQLGRDRFDGLVSEVGHWGVKDVFSRETAEGVAFFRAVDMVKKRAQRERVFQSLDAVDVPVASGDTAMRAWRAALREAIDHKLNPREASLINDTLMGKTPAEIALQWGVAPKTISNEKTRVLQKLRDALLAQNVD
jgi:RNA polymerase sigma factor (sigma-70 family)